MTNDNLSRRRFLLNRRPVSWIIAFSVQHYRWRCTSPWGWLEEIKRWSLARQTHPLIVQNLLTASKHPHSSLSSCCSSLPVPITVLKHLDASFSQSNPLSQLRHHQGALLRLRLNSLSFLKGALPPNFNKMVRREIMNVVVQQPLNTFSIVCTNLCAWLNILWLGTNDVRAGGMTVLTNPSEIRTVFLPYMCVENRAFTATVCSDDRVGSFRYDSRTF
jgi:hypothetical protein